MHKSVSRYNYFKSVEDWADGIAAHQEGNVLPGRSVVALAEKPFGVPVAQGHFRL